MESSFGHHSAVYGTHRTKMISCHKNDASLPSQRDEKVRNKKWSVGKKEKKKPKRRKKKRRRDKREKKRKTPKKNEKCTLQERKFPLSGLIVKFIAASLA